MKDGVWPRPVLSALIAAAWLVLQESLSLPNLVTAAVLAWGLPHLLRGFLAGSGRASSVDSAPGKSVRRSAGTRLRAAALLFAAVLRDIVVSNLAVARMLLRPGPAEASIWVSVPLSLRSPSGRAWLAGIVTMTPGTLSCEVDDASPTLLVHALDGRAGAEAIAADIRQRYEAPLMEIFD
jgi:multicomponent K+:H+ antiporter subunit E